MGEPGDEAPRRERNRRRERAEVALADDSDDLLSCACSWWAHTVANATNNTIRTKRMFNCGLSGGGVEDAVLKWGHPFNKLTIIICGSANSPVRARSGFAGRASVLGSQVHNPSSLIRCSAPRSPVVTRESQPHSPALLCIQLLYTPGSIRLRRGAQGMQAIPTTNTPTLQHPL